MKTKEDIPCKNCITLPICKNRVNNYMKKIISDNISADHVFREQSSVISLMLDCSLVKKSVNPTKKKGPFNLDNLDIDVIVSLRKFYYE